MVHEPFYNDPSDPSIEDLKSELKSQLNKIADQGYNMSRQVTIILLRRTISFLDNLSTGTNNVSGSPPPVTKPPSSTARSTEEVFVPIEQTPQRMHVTVWRLGECKRCGRNDMENGGWIVKIMGKGWWHDKCFRIVRPDFYRGMDD